MAQLACFKSQGVAFSTSWSLPRRAMADLSVRLQSACSRELAFIQQVHRHSDVLLDSDVLKLAVARYEWLWLPFTARSAGPLAVGHLDVPLDIAFVWHCHVLTGKHYFDDCHAILGVVPDFTYPALTKATAVEPWTRPRGWFQTSLNSREAALAGMWHSLKSAIELPEELPADSAALASALPLSQLALDMEAVGEQHHQAFYATSLPHYSHSHFIERSVAQYLAFLRVCAVQPAAKLCPPPHVDLVWRAHMATPLRYKADAEAALGVHLGRGGGRPGPPLPLLQAATQQLFAAAGATFFLAGGMFRGAPARHRFGDLDHVLPEAPPSAAALTLVSWHCGAAPSSKEALPCAVAGWHLDPAFKPFGGRMLPCSAPPQRHPAARVGEAMLMPDHISLVVGLQLVCADPGNPDRPRLSTVRCRGTVTAARLLRKGPGHVMTLTARAQVSHSESETIRVSLRCRGVFDRLCCKIPAFGGTAKAPRLEGRVVDHAIDHVAHPLLLPPEALSSVKADVAEVVTFPVHMHGMQCGAPPEKAALKVKLINTLTHMASIVEVFAAAADGGSAAAVPAATAHTANLAQLPTARMLGGCEVGALRPEAAQRAMVVRSAGKCEDWALLIGSWVPGERHPTRPGGWLGEPRGPGHLQWELLLLRSASPASTPLHYGGAGSRLPSPGGQGPRPQEAFQRVRMDSSGDVSTGDLELSQGHTCRFVIDHRRGLLSCDFGDGHGCGSGQEAGALAALLTAVAVSVGVLHALCMPCSRNVTHPHQPRAALRQVAQDTQSAPPFPEAAPWCQPALRCLCLPTNGYISKRMARVHAQAETGRITPFEADIAMQPWFGPRGSDAGGASADELCAAFWGGRDLPVGEFLALKRRWAVAHAVQVAPCVPLPGATARRPCPDDGAAEAKKRPGGGESLSVWVAGAGNELVGCCMLRAPMETGAS